MRNAETALPLEVHETARGLATMEWVRRELELDALSILAKVESGELLWVFNVSTRADGQIRRLLFWPLEVIALRAREPSARASLRSLWLDDALTQILGTSKDYLRAAEVAQLLLLSPPTVWGLWKSGELSGVMTGHALKLSRRSLEIFLTNRLLWKP